MFPKIAGDGNLFCYDLPSYWMDVGQPHDYITGMQMYLQGLKEDDSKL